MTLRKILTCLAVAAALMLALGNLSLNPTAKGQPATETATLVPLPTVENPVGPVPTNCPHGPEPMVLSSHFGPGIGGYPAWAIGFGGPHATMPIYAGNLEPSRYGWPQKVLWVVKRSYPGLVRLRGANLADGVQLWFEIGGRREVTVAPVLKAPEPAIPYQTEGWAEFPSYLYIPRAGCYTLEAEWEGGFWRVNFAAGRPDEDK